MKIAKGTGRPRFVIAHPAALAARHNRGQLALTEPLYEALRRRDKHGRFNIYQPYTHGGQAIYVHAKVLIVDDDILRIGSSNINNRSLGLDTECDVVIDGNDAENRDKVAEISRIRNSLLAEHLGVGEDIVAQSISTTQSLIGTIESMRHQTNKLRPYVLPEVNDVAAWLADNEILDPEGPDEMFEGVDKRGLFRRNWFNRTFRS